MKLIEFHVRKYRNIIDSGWIRVEQITAFVGQNECGKSNLLEALRRLNPYDGVKYQIDEDWPIDQWPPGESSQVVCTAKFALTRDEIAQLVTHSEPPPPPPPPGVPGETYEPIPDATPPVPPQQLVIVGRSYDDTVTVQFDPPLDDLYEMTKAEGWVKARLPRCVYMSDFAAFSGHAELDQLWKKLTENGNRRDQLAEHERTICIVLDLADLSMKKLLEKASSAGGRTARGFDTNAASAHLTRQFKHMWKQKGVKFNLRVDGPSFDVLVEDEGLGAFVPLERRSRGFQWFVSFIWRFTHASKGDFSNCILLLDEPGVHLHHAGHRDLLDFFESLSETNTLLFTTHLATMIDPAYPERVRIMEVHQHHASIKNGMVTSQRQPMMVIEAQLGLSGAMGGLLGSRQNLIVEGGEDAMILHKLSGLLSKSGREGLSDRIFLIPAQSASKTPMYAGFMIGNGLDAGVLLDSDDAGNKAKKKITDLYLKQLADQQSIRFRTIMLNDATGMGQNEASIEDLFSPEFYLECVNEAYGTNIAVNELPTDGSDMIVKRVELVLKARGFSGLDRQRLVAPMMKRFDKMSTLDDLPAGTAEKAGKLVAAINRNFN